jgi:hypothetical protein
VRLERRSSMARCLRLPAAALVLSDSGSILTAEVAALGGLVDWGLGSAALLWRRSLAPLALAT